MLILEDGWLNLTYIGYVDEELFNVIQSVQFGTITYKFWLAVNVTDRKVINGSSWRVGTYYFGWIPPVIRINEK
ncbi:MAG: hypothetical protein ACE5R6_18145 [Candidatus Heimdallarchaeota archaeon]